MSCENHKKEVAGIADMRLLAEMIGDLHYKSLLDLLWHLHAKIGNDGLNDSKEGRQKLAESLCMASGDLFQAAKNIRNAWKISEPFMSKREQSAQEGDASKADSSTNAGNQPPITEQGKESKDFARWLSGEGWQQYDEADRWICPSESKKVVTTSQLYTIYKKGNL